MDHSRVDTELSGKINGAAQQEIATTGAIADLKVRIREKTLLIAKMQRQLGPVFGVGPKAEASKPAPDHTDGLDNPPVPAAEGSDVTRADRQPLGAGGGKHATEGPLRRGSDGRAICSPGRRRVADVLKPVDLIAWDNLRPGMGKRTRRRGDYLLVLQKPVVSARTWRDHGIPNRWAEKADRNLHPHAKPVGLIARLIAATTMPGNLVVDPAAGGFGVLHAARQLGREFLGCDLVLPSDSPTDRRFRNTNPHVALGCIAAEGDHPEA